MKISSHPFPVLILVFSIVCALHAETAEEREFQQLKQKHAGTPAGASEMVDRQYRLALESLLRRVSTGAQPELTRQVQAELQATAGAQAATAPVKTSAAPATRAATQSELKKLFENSQWRAFEGLPNGKEKPGTFIFIKDGTCKGEGIGGKWAARRFWEIKTPGTLKLFVNNPEKKRDLPFVAMRVDFDGKTAKYDPTLGGEATGTFRLEYDQPIDRKK